MPMNKGLFAIVSQETKKYKRCKLYILGYINTYINIPNMPNYIYI